MPRKNLTILHFNDSLGYLDQHQELFSAGDRADYRPAAGIADPEGTELDGGDCGGVLCRRDLGNKK